MSLSKKCLVVSLRIKSMQFARWKSTIIRSAKLFCYDCQSKFSQGIANGTLSLSHVIYKLVRLSLEPEILSPPSRIYQLPLHPNFKPKLLKRTKRLSLSWVKNLTLSLSAVSATKVRIYMRRSVDMSLVYLAGRLGLRKPLNVQLVVNEPVKIKSSQ